MVEKDDDLRSLYRRKLEQKFQGCVVVEAPSGAEALDVLGHASIDAIVVNQAALDGTGLEVLQTIRRTDARIPLVSIGPAQVEGEALRSGATVFIDDRRWADLGKTVEEVLPKNSEEAK
ncbi:MAG: response regulator [Verrucomicrobiota bacterium]